MRISHILAACLATSVLAAPALAADKMKPADGAMKPMNDTMKSSDGAMKPMKDNMKSSDGMKPMKDGSMMTMMKGGEVVAVMADGHMGTTKISDHKMMDSMMKMGKPMKGCAMFMTGADGKTMAIDTSSKKAMAECEKIAK